MTRRRTCASRHDWLEPFWILAMVCYTANCLIQWMHPSTGWMSHYWNDIWMLPCAVPVVIRIYAILNLRQPPLIPSTLEIILMGLLWSIMAECLAPLWFSTSTADPFDFLAYASGGCLLWMRWHLIPRLNHGFEFEFR